jgi:nitrite reductase/ring-hydroxylating ferredoxin subunit
MTQSRRKVVVGPVDTFPAGSCQRVEIGSRSIAVFHVDGRFYALKNVCPHQGAELSSGTVIGELTAEAPGDYCYRGSRKRVRCPWHGWEYDLETGASSFDPAHNRVRSYPVSVAAGDMLAPELGEETRGRQPGLYVAETFPVSVEHDYVVVEL